MRNVIAFALLLGSAVLGAAETTTTAAGEYAKHFGPLKDLTVAVAQAMPIEHWAFRPHPESMNFGMLMSHIATTNYQFCAGLMDSASLEHPDAITVVSRALNYSKDLTLDLDPYTVAVIEIRAE